jgi:pyridoxine kinase
MRGRELALVRGQGVIRGDVKASEGRELVFWDGFWDL